MGGKKRFFAAVGGRKGEKGTREGRVHPIGGLGKKRGERKCIGGRKVRNVDVCQGKEGKKGKKKQEKLGSTKKKKEKKVREWEKRSETKDP